LYNKIFNEYFIKSDCNLVLKERTAKIRKQERTLRNSYFWKSRTHTAIHWKPQRKWESAVHISFRRWPYVWNNPWRRRVGSLDPSQVHDSRGQPYSHGLLPCITGSL